MQIRTFRLLSAWARPALRRLDLQPAARPGGPLDPRGDRRGGGTPEFAYVEACESWAAARRKAAR